MNPLIIAEAANPEWVSVPLVGWSHARAIQKVIGGHLVTQIRNAEAIERSGVDPSEFTAIDSEAVASAMWKIGDFLSGDAGKGWTTKMAASALPYYYFERLLWKQFGPRIKSGEFSLVHRVTPLSPTMPSLIARKCAKHRVPFVVGPLNGGLPWPREFDAERRREREWLSYLRSAYKLLPYYRSTRKYASAIICGSQHTLAQMPAWAKDKIIYLPENGVDLDRFSGQRSHTAALPIKAVFLGRLVPYKGCDIVLESAAELIKQGKLILEIVGDGPERQALENQTAELGIQHGVTFAGNVPHEQVVDKLVNKDLLTFPSIREFGGGVILEAMTVGLPSMAVNYGGPAELMTASTAFPIELGSRSEIVDRMRAGLEQVVSNPTIIAEKSQACVDRVRKLFTWEAKARQIEQIYSWVLGKTEKPTISFE
ncbi:glycosyltransferase family 4 protein [Aeoliella mucimassa]|uniref:2-deoxystreptamine glucosyltransferase n=1 Tax=Aeoliella mucimassa TaxID=2527972 RepID=A0A518AJZ4_9BACT|nr:glycosyltransferase [Aeoliella mucimassa]QDU55049.1 2-deoxystreptamine glucosyltransferase [Aeoliella mucimassa]